MQRAIGQAIAGAIEAGRAANGAAGTMTLVVG